MEVLQQHGYEVLERVYAADGCIVFKGTHPGCTNCTPQVALKVQTFPNAAAAGIVMREIENQKALQSHPNVVRLFEYFSEPHTDGKYSVYLSVEWMTKDLMKDMQQRSKNQFPWPEAELIKISLTLIQVLADAERMGICHRDIKPQNIFFDTATQTVKLGDFGSSICGVKNGVQEATLVGTPQFMSKELKDAMLMNVVRISHDVVKSDVYSLGVTLTTLARLEVPVRLIFQSDRNSIAQELTLVRYSEYVKGMLWDMLNPDVEQRLTFVQLQQKYPGEQPVLSSIMSLPLQSLSERGLPQPYFQTVAESIHPRVEAGQWYSQTLQEEGGHWGQAQMQSQYPALNSSASQQASQLPMSATVWPVAPAQNACVEQPSWNTGVPEEQKVQYQGANEAAQQYQREYEAAQRLQDYYLAQQLQQAYNSELQASQNSAKHPIQEISQCDPQLSLSYYQESSASAERSRPEQMSPYSHVEGPSPADLFDQHSFVRAYNSSYLPGRQSQPAVARSNPNPASNSEFEKPSWKGDDFPIWHSISPQPGRHCSPMAPTSLQNSRDKCILCNKLLAGATNMVHLRCSNCGGMQFCCDEHFETYVQYVTDGFNSMDMICCFCGTPTFYGDIEKAFGGETEMKKKMKKAFKSMLCRRCNMKKAKIVLECGDLLCDKCYSSSWISPNADCPVCRFKAPKSEGLNSSLIKWAKKKFQKVL